MANYTRYFGQGMPDDLLALPPGDRPVRAEDFRTWSDFGPWVRKMLRKRSARGELTFASGLGESGGGMGIDNANTGIGDQHRGVFCMNVSDPGAMQAAIEDAQRKGDKLSVHRLRQLKDMHSERKEIKSSNKIRPELDGKAFRMGPLPGVGSVHGATSDTEDKGIPSSLCVSEDEEFDVADLFHLRPVADMLESDVFLDLDEGRNFHSRDGSDLFVVHLETLSHDMNELYLHLCERYAWEEGCAGVNSTFKFPKVFPSSNTVRKACQLADVMGPEGETDYKQPCEVKKWMDLWSGENADLVRLVRDHFSRDFQLFGYSLDPRRTKPLKWQ